MSTYPQWLETLNEAQKEAVSAPLGHHLVLAGAGSGKTRVLVHRIAWLLTQHQASPNSILAVTFTNKAAGEMRDRLTQLAGHSARGMWVGTFHGLGHQLLRQHYTEAGLSEHFQVLDSEDQLRAIKRLMKDRGIDEERFEPPKVQHFINRKKDEGLRAGQLGNPQHFYDRVMIEVYQLYEDYCLKNQLVDFAELLLGSYCLLRDNAELLTHYQARFKHFLIDEFQDTNTIQYAWFKLLATPAQSIMIVGDDDQSIYGWRGAKIENLKRFERDFPGTHTIRLEQNYRSTGTILSAANALINHNTDRMGKSLWTEGESGEKITVYCALNEEDEAHFMVRHIKQHIDNGGSLSDIGILYRSNMQSRVVEEGLVRASIPYRIYGGVRFFERAEIKDIMAYLHLALNLENNAAFERVVNVPPRGIGQKTIDKIREKSTMLGGHWRSANQLLDEEALTGRGRVGLQGFLDIICSLREALASEPFHKVVAQAVNTSGLIEYFHTQSGERAQSRVENLEELINAAHDFTEEKQQEDPETEVSLEDFLAYAALEGGEYSQQNSQGVQLMTLHSAKGLEFPVVFMCGMEQGLFPHHLAKESLTGLEEERRLCYVGITRAQQKLYLTHAERRRIFGREELRRASSFLHEVPTDLVEEQGRKVALNRGLPRQGSVGQSLRATPNKQASGIQLGARVRHAKFGAGTVIDFEEHTDKARVHVHFDRTGAKWLILAMAKLEVLPA